MAKIKKSNYIIDPIFPTREIHIVAGASGAGKSTLMSQIADQLLKGEDIFGYTPNPISGIAYLAFDRTTKGMGRTFERSLQNTETPFPFYSTINSPEFSKPEYRDPVGAIKRLHELHPEVDVLIVDGIGMAFRGDSAKLDQVSGFIHHILRALDELPTDLTIFAIHHMSKQKKGNEYAQARAKLHGSIAWAATAETIILIEPENDSDPENPNRILTLSPRNSPDKVYTYCFDEYGRLIPGAKLEDPSKGKKSEFFAAVHELPEGEVPVHILKALAMSYNISDATYNRWLKELVEGGGVLSKLRRGVYVRVSSVLN
jgi:AAA domain